MLNKSITTKQHCRHSSRPGFSLLDSVLSLSIVAVIITIYAGFALNRQANRHVALRAQAAALANEELSALRQMDFATIGNQSSGPFLNMQYNAGSWSIVQDDANLSGSDSENDSGHVGANVVELAGSSAFSGAVSGRLLYPAGAYSQGEIRTKFRVLNDSPSGWAVGFLFHASDPLNGYRLRLGVTGANLDGAGHNLVLDQLINGVATNLFTKSVTCSVNVWYALRVVLADAAPTIKIYYNGVQQDSSTISDDTYTAGPAALLGWGGVHARFDNVKTITSSAIGFWTFDGYAELPASWTRLGLNSLPDNTPNIFDDNRSLTIAPYPQVDSVNLKKATVTVSWREGTQSRSYTLESLLGKSTIGR